VDAFDMNKPQAAAGGLVVVLHFDWIWQNWIAIFGREKTNANAFLLLIEFVCLPSRTAEIRMSIER
jgi:hypothetical protein